MEYPQYRFTNKINCQVFPNFRLFSDFTGTRQKRNEILVIRISFCAIWVPTKPVLQKKLFLGLCEFLGGFQAFPTSTTISFGFRETFQIFWRTFFNRDVPEFLKKIETYGFWRRFRSCRSFFNVVTLHCKWEVRKVWANLYT